MSNDSKIIRHLRVYRSSNDAETIVILVGTWYLIWERKSPGGYIIRYEKSLGGYHFHHFQSPKEKKQLLVGTPPSV